MTADVLAIGAHPDDVELGMGGTLLVLAAQGKKTAVVDLTRGELGTRGNPETRAREAAAATRILKLSSRENLGLRDGGVEDNQESRLAIIRVLRKYRPRLVFTHHPGDRLGHPDHGACSRLVQHAVYLSGLTKIDTGQERHRPEAVICFNIPRRLFPSFVVDVSEVYSQAHSALVSYQSQFYNPKSADPQTSLSNPRFLDQVEAMYRYYGALIGADYGEAFWCDRAVRITDPMQHFVRGV